MSVVLRAVAASDQGLVRSNNEDAVFVGDRLLVVADGMGGLPAGELASDILVRALADVDAKPDSGEPLQDLIAAVGTANERIEAAVADDDARDGMGTTVTTLLLSGDRAQRTQQLSALLDGYEQVRDFDRAELRLIEPLRTLRLIHYSAWLARRWEDPIFPVNFPWFGTPDYWRGQVLMLQEQVEQMQEAPLVA